jgi:diadenosine tetraphosphate (Ap4A) HIT family hydrolase
MASSHHGEHGGEACPLCSAIAEAKADELVFERGPWIALTLIDVPGWLRVMTKRHAEGPWSLSEEEASTMGGVLQSVSEVTRSVTGAERVHIVGLGEGAVHFHYAVLPRLPGETPVFTGAPLVARAAEAADARRSAEIAARLRSAFAAGEIG